MTKDVLAAVFSKTLPGSTELDGHKVGGEGQTSFSIFPQQRFYHATFDFRISTTRAQRGLGVLS